MFLLFVLSAVAIGYGADDSTYKSARDFVSRNVNNASSSKRAECFKHLASALGGESDDKCVELACGVLRAEVMRVSGREIKDEVNMSAQVIAGFLQLAKAVKSQEGTEELLHQAKRRQSGVLSRYRFLIVAALGFNRTEGVYELYDKLLSRKDGMLHIAVATSFAFGLEQNKVTKRDREILFKILEDDYTWEAKWDALQAFHRVKDTESVERLIRLFADKRLGFRLKAKLIDVLKAATKLDINSDSPIVWLNAWKRKQIGGNKDVTSIQPPEFFGLKIRSDRMVIILDKSGSMSSPAGNYIETEKPLPEIIITGDKRPQDPYNPEKELKGEELSAYLECRRLFNEWIVKKPATRMDLLKIQTVKLLFNLHPDMLFNIVIYADTVDSWKKTLLKASWATKLEAINYMIKLSPNGMTNICDSLVAAYRYKAFKKGKNEVFVYDESSSPFDIFGGADTFVLLTDGAPNRGAIPAADGIYELTIKLSLFRKICINTIGLGISQSPFLSQMAANNFGSARFFR